VPVVLVSYKRDLKKDVKSELSGRHSEGLQSASHFSDDKNAKTKVLFSLFFKKTLLKFAL